MNTPGTAANSDARKRNAEREQSGSFSPTGPTSPTSTYSTTTNADQPPTLPDTSEALAEAIRVVAESRFALNEAQSRAVRAVREASEWIIAALTPPPAEPEPAWAAISEDPVRPTLARVTFDYGDEGEVVTAFWTRQAATLRNGRGTWDLAYVTSVVVLHTYDPETHVPVERALIAEAFDFIVEHGEGAPTDLERRLRAALADGDKS